MESLKFVLSFRAAPVAVSIIALLTLFCAACTDQDLRGSSTASPDGKTYLVVADDNGGHCGPIKVDGKPWPYAIGKAGRIDPGSHTIECGGAITFNIGSGVVFKFDYWGP